MFDLKPDDVSLFTIQIGRAPATALIKDEKTNTWQLVGDPEFRVDQNAVSDRLAALLDLKVKDYVGNQAGEEGLYGLDVPRVKFTVTNKAKNNTEVLEVGKGEPGNIGTSYARTGKSKDVFTVQLSADMFVLAAQIADKHFAAVDLKKLKRMEIDVDKKTYELKLENGEWKLLRPEQTTYATADVRKVNAFLGLLFGAMAVCSDACWALAASRARDWFAKKPKRLDHLGLTGGVMMVGLGAGLAATGNASSH